VSWGWLLASEPIELVSPLDALFLCIDFLLALPITSIFSARLEAGSKVARTGVPSRMAERSLLVLPLLSTICVLSSTVKVRRSPWRELITTVFLSESTFDTRPTVDFRFAAEELLSIEPREAEVPIELSPVEPLPLWPYVEALEPVPLCP
jgi:hypothetical protein